MNQPLTSHDTSVSVPLSQDYLSQKIQSRPRASKASYSNKPTSLEQNSEKETSRHVEKSPRRRLKGSGEKSSTLSERAKDGRSSGKKQHESDPEGLGEKRVKPGFKRRRNEKTDFLTENYYEKHSIKTSVRNRRNFQGNTSFSNCESNNDPKNSMTFIQGNHPSQQSSALDSKKATSVDPTGKLDSSRKNPKKSPGSRLQKMYNRKNIEIISSNNYIDQRQRGKNDHIVSRSYGATKKFVNSQALSSSIFAE